MKKYFAYGSCTNIKDFEKTLEKAGCKDKYRLIGVGRLEGYRLAFTRLRNDGSGALDIIKSKGEYVLGLVYEIPEEAVDAIDEREGSPLCYKKDNVKVTLLNSETEVFTYFVVDKKMEEVCPSEEYFDKCLTGMRMWLPNDYVNKYFITHVNRKFNKSYELLCNETKHVTVADKIKDMNPEELKEFQKERYEKFIKPLMNSNIKDLEDRKNGVNKTVSSLS